ncbi:MAG: PTS sugar transporter subunit IIA [Gammaproteobacteria bacterium]|nr:PTS sugar transporter subunit IIA [Gammaproteobacteria bacterium]
MDVAKLLKPDSVHCGLSARSKKHALELLSQALAASSEAANAEEILEGLIQRERLGCTGLGRSVAMPHTRLSGLDQSVGAFLRLDDAVDFDSVDGAPVDLLFGLLVPEDCDDDQIREVRELIERLGDSALQQQLHQAQEPAQLYELLTESLTIIHKTLRA